jgi:hypothetical protein
MNTTDDLSLVGRASQRHYYDEACDPEFEITRPHGCGRLYQFYIFTDKEHTVINDSTLQPRFHGL